MAELRRSTRAAARSSCCSPAAQETCCEPEAKDECCGPDHEAGTCGCSASAEDEVRERVRERYAAGRRRGQHGVGVAAAATRP